MTFGRLPTQTPPNSSRALKNQMRHPIHETQTEKSFLVVGDFRPHLCSIQSLRLEGEAGHLCACLRSEEGGLRSDIDDINFGADL